MKFHALCLSLFLLPCLGTAGEPPQEKRLLFLGDSITQAGTYVVQTETILRAKHRDRPWEFINVGLSSETVSGLSEEGHAGGKFPRPDLHERLERVLDGVKPELVVACYGMNCGIYLPLEEERFAAFRAGIEKLHAAVEKRGAKIIHLTPAFFDEKKAPKPGYAAVLQAYTDWLLEKRKDGWIVLDVHAAMKQAVEEGRKTKPDFFLSGDGVHPGDEGHWLMARSLLVHWGVAEIGGATTFDEAKTKVTVSAEFEKLIKERQGILQFAWLSQTGHKRPGVPKGVPVPEAEKRAKEIEAALMALP